MTKESWAELYSKTSKVSLSDHNKYVHYFSNRLGKHNVEKGSHKATAVFVNELEDDMCSLEVNKYLTKPKSLEVAKEDQIAHMPYG